MSLRKGCELLLVGLAVVLIDFRLNHGVDIVFDPFGYAAAVLGVLWIRQVIHPDGRRWLAFAAPLYALAALLGFPGSMVEVPAPPGLSIRTDPLSLLQGLELLVWIVADIALLLGIAAHAESQGARRIAGHGRVAARLVLVALATMSAGMALVVATTSTGFVGLVVAGAVMGVIAFVAMLWVVWGARRLPPATAGPPGEVGPAHGSAV